MLKQSHSLTALLTAALLAANAIPADARPARRSYHGRSAPRYTVRHRSSGWSTAGHILAGVAIGSVLQNAYSAPTRTVTTHRTVYVTPPAGGYITVPAPSISPIVTYTTAAMRETFWVVNSNGSQTAVEMRRDLDGSYLGPRGERYPIRPTNDQLRMIYGF